MSYHDRIMEIMQSDPEHEWTASEIAEKLYGDRRTANTRSRISVVLGRAENYGFVKKSRSQRGKPTFWVLV